MIRLAAQDRPMKVGMPMELPIPFISRVWLTNYKSIASCDVRLSPLTVLVGPNGAGKSNFLDALRFVSDAVANSPEQAISARGGLGEILRRGPGAPDEFSVDLEVTVPWGPSPSQWARGRYGFTIASADRPGERPFIVSQEHCELRWEDREVGFTVSSGRVVEVSSNRPVRDVDIDPERLYLAFAGRSSGVGPLYADLRGMYFYDPEPHKLRASYLQAEHATLGRAGEHLGDVLGSLDPVSKERLNDYMRAVVPDLAWVDRKFAGDYVTVELRTRTGDEQQPEISFGPNAMSDGTIRAAGLLAALFQSTTTRSHRIRLIGIEEPELAVHPAAAGALFDALTEASERVQIVMTTQSPDLLDRDDLDVQAVRVANIHQGATIIGEIDEPSRQIAAQKLATVGQLLRGNQLTPQNAE
jgi:predicted ATPase